MLPSKGDRNQVGGPFKDRPVIDIHSLYHRLVLSSFSLVVSIDSCILSHIIEILKFCYKKKNYKLTIIMSDIGAAAYIIEIFPQVSYCKFIRVFLCNEPIVTKLSPYLHLLHKTLHMEFFCTLLLRCQDCGMLSRTEGNQF